MQMARSVDRVEETIRREVLASLALQACPGSVGTLILNLQVMTTLIWTSQNYQKEISIVLSAKMMLSISETL